MKIALIYCYEDKWLAYFTIAFSNRNQPRRGQIKLKEKRKGEEKGEEREENLSNGNAKP